VLALASCSGVGHAMSFRGAQRSPGLRSCCLSTVWLYAVTLASLGVFMLCGEFFRSEHLNSWTWVKEGGDAYETRHAR
jgi:hypothetical protein